MVSPYSKMSEGVYINAKEVDLNKRLHEITNDYTHIIECIRQASKKNNSEKKEELEKALVYLIEELNKLK